MKKYQLFIKWLTHIQSAEATDSACGDIYTLDGRLMRRNATLQGLPKGIYLMNGKKVAVK